MKKVVKVAIIMFILIFALTCYSNAETNYTKQDIIDFLENWTDFNGAPLTYVYRDRSWDTSITNSNNAMEDLKKYINSNDFSQSALNSAMENFIMAKTNSENMGVSELSKLSNVQFSDISYWTSMGFMDLNITFRVEDYAPEGAEFRFITFLLSDGSKPNNSFGYNDSIIVVLDRTMEVSDTRVKNVILNHETFNDRNKDGEIQYSELVEWDYCTTKDEVVIDFLPTDMSIFSYMLTVNLTFKNASEITDLEFLKTCEKINANITLDSLPNLESTVGISNYKGGRLDITNCPKLKEIDLTGTSAYVQIQEPTTFPLLEKIVYPKIEEGNYLYDSFYIDLHDFSNLKTIDLSQINKAIGGISLVNLPKLEKVIGVGEVSGSLSVDNCPQLNSIDINGNIKRIRFDSVQNLENLSINTILNTESFSLRGDNKVKFSNLDFLKDSKDINSISIENVKTLTDISALTGFTKIEAFSLKNCAVADLTPIKDSKDIYSLYVEGNNVADISCIKDMTKLDSVSFANNKISDVSALYNKDTITLLLLDNNQITDDAIITNLKNVKNISLSNNKIQGKITLDNVSLESLNLKGNGITGVTFNNCNINALYLEDNKISNLTLNGLTNSILKLDGNNLQEIPSNISTVSGLRYFSIKDNNITDISLLQNLKLTTVILSGNNIKDLSKLNFKEIINLEIANMGISSIDLSKAISLMNLDVSKNNLTQIPNLPNPEKIITLNISENNISNITSLKNMTKLYSVYMNGTLVDESNAQTADVLNTLKSRNVYYEINKTVEEPEPEPVEQPKPEIVVLHEDTEEEQSVLVLSKTTSKFENNVQNIVTEENFPGLSDNSISIVVKNKNGKVVEGTERIGTRSVITVYDDEENIIEEYTIAINGDIDGDGRARIFDSFTILEDTFDDYDYDDIDYMTRDYNNDGKIRIFDAFSYLEDAI